MVFMENAIPGQRVRVRIIRKKKQYAEARVVELLSQSPYHTPPVCSHFGVCGGCSWQNLVYEEQLRWKRLHVLESIEHVAGVSEVSVDPTVPSPRTMHYRNKMEYTFADRRWLLPEEISAKDVAYSRSFALGLHVRGSFDKVFDLDDCVLQSPRSAEIVRCVRDWARESGLPAYTTRTHQGFWRFLVIREGKHTAQTLLHLITAPHPRADEVADALAAHVAERIPGITTFVHSISQKKAQVAVGDTSRTVFGPGYIEELLGGLRFRISAHSFFQTNPYAVEKLYETARDFAGFTGNETVWDLYCGAGSIAIFIASFVKRVTGFEVVEDAVEDAYRNCRLNGIDNCRFVAGDLKDEIGKARDAAGPGGLPDVVITDPPRAGMHPDVTKTLLELAPKRIVAVSCNPATLARDLAMLGERYEIKRIRPFDMFPHTPHIECVVRLDKK